MKFKLRYIKAWLSAFGGSLVILLIYNFTISETFQIKEQIVQAESEIEKFTAQQQLSNSNANMVKYSELRTENSVSVQQEVLHMINYEKESLLHKMFEIEEVKGDDFTIQIQPILLEGNFFDLLKALHRIENKATHLHVSSVKIYRERNRKTRKEELYMKIYVQKIV